MFEYGALFDSSFAEQLHEALRAIINQLAGLPYYWYIIGLLLLALFVKALTIK